MFTEGDMGRFHIDNRVWKSNRFYQLTRVSRQEILNAWKIYFDNLLTLKSSFISPFQGKDSLEPRYVVVGSLDISSFFCVPKVNV